MNLRQLEAFRATMLAGSITGAAQNLRISQPSVSRLIAELERSVGFALFDRAGRGLSATEEARRFYQSVEMSFTGIEQLKSAADMIRNASGGLITVGVIQSIAAHELPRAVSATLKSHADVRFMMQSRNTPAILDAVATGQFDVGIVGRQPPYPGVETLASVAAPYVALVPEDHPLADQPGTLDLEELALTESFVTFGGVFPDDMMGMERGLSKRMRDGSRISATNMPLAAAMVREAGVFAIADPFSAEQAVRMGGVVFRPLKQSLSYQVAVICKSRSHLPRAAIDFAERLAAQIQTRADEIAGLTGA